MTMSASREEEWQNGLVIRSETLTEVTIGQAVDGIRFQAGRDRPTFSIVNSRGDRQRSRQGSALPTSGRP
jgi:hypothetical protein